MLDVGCGDGAAMVRAAGLGWEAEGCEISDAACARARQRGFTCYAGEWGEQLPSGSYHLVHMSHVLEHLRDPSGTLGCVRESLVDGGRLLLGLPNWDCSMARAFGTAWWANKAPEHIWHFRCAHVTQMLRTHGFRVDRVLPQNLLFAALRPSVARAQWGVALAAGWGRPTTLNSYAVGLSRAVWNRLSGAMPLSGEGFAYVLDCTAIEQRQSQRT